MTTIEAIEARIEELTQKRLANQEKMKPMYKENSQLTDEILELQAQVLKLQSEQISTEEEMIQFYIVDDGYSHGMDHYHARNRFFESIGLSVSGYYPETNQAGFQLKLISDGSNIDSTREAIEKVLPYITAINGENYDRNSIKRFGIFEYTCSEYGSYSLIYDEDTDEWIISKIAWHRRSEVQQFKMLKEALDYISKNLHYDYPEYKD